MTTLSTPLLQVDSLITGYANKQILNNVALEVSAGEIVALVGHNGAGKSTLLKVIFGLIPIWQGWIWLEGKLLLGPSPHKLLASGVSYVPQGNRVFGELTVRENLEIGGTTITNKKTLNERIDRALSLFPSLKPRLRQRAGILSGGEKQMLALANALILFPRILLLDEPSLGLAPALVTETLEKIVEIAQEGHIAVLVVEQKVREVLKIAHRIYVMRNGSIAHSCRAEDLRDDKKLRDAYL